MKFATATLTLFVNAAVSVAVPEAAPPGMVQKLDMRAVSGDLIFGRSFPCSSNNPTTCCAVSRVSFYILPITSLSYESRVDDDAKLSLTRNDSAVVGLELASMVFVAAMGEIARC
jgi:hypothetical protein